MVDLQTAQLLAPAGKLRLFRQVGGKTYQGDAGEEQYPWLFELVRWHPGTGRDLGLIAADLRQALQLLAELEEDAPRVPTKQALSEFDQAESGS